MSALEVLILGVVQGLTEFLPVSSSGHLVISSRILGFIEESRGPVVEVALHVGTLLAILMYYRQDLFNALRFLGGRIDKTAQKGDTGALLGWIALGSVPTAILGLYFKEWFESCFTNPLGVGCALCLTGSLCFLTRWIPRGQVAIASMGPLRPLAIGLAQGLAIIPGISRSGATIVTALALGMAPREAGRFSFLLSVPAVAGAAALKLIESNNGVGSGTLLLGISASAAVGFICLGILTRILKTGHFYYFGYYCVPLGLFVILYFL